MPRSRSGEAPLIPGPGWLGRILVVVLGLNVALAWMAIQASLVFTHAVWLAVAGQILAEAEPRRIAAQIATLRLVQAVLWLGAAGLFLAWIHRAHRHLRAAGVARAADPGEVLRAFLTPGPNVLRAPRAVATLWRTSGPALPPGAVDRWVTWWWGLCLASVASDFVTALSSRGFRGFVGLEGGLGLLTLGEGLRITAAVLTIVIVGRIDRCQHQLLGTGVARAEPLE